MINDRLANCNEIDEEEILPMRRKLCSGKTNQKKRRMQEMIDREVTIRLQKRKSNDSRRV